jgi:Fic family protein
MTKTGNMKILKTVREESGQKVRDISAHTGIDASLISRYESGARMPAEDQLALLAEAYGIDARQLRVEWLKARIMRQLAYEPLAGEALSLVMDELADYHKKQKKAQPKNVRKLCKEADALRNELRAIRQKDSRRVTEALEMEYIYESNRIEGNTLTLHETDLVVNQGLTIGGKSMREHLEAINHREAIDFVRELATHKAAVTERDLLGIHNLILRGIDPHNAGRYRNVQVMISGSRHVPPAPWKVADEMADFFKWYRQQAPAMHPLVLAAELHLRLVGIHPFTDGNGRTSRLLMNLVLLQHGYVIANIKGDNNTRQAYYNALEEAHTQGNREGFIAFVGQVAIACLQRYITILS